MTDEERLRTQDPLGLGHLLELVAHYPEVRAAMADIEDRLARCRRPLAAAGEDG